VNGTGDLRPDEGAVRLVFVEHCRDYAALVCETLESTCKGRFEVRKENRLDAAAHEVERGEFDAVLVDLTGGSGLSIEDASTLATRVPVIVLTGSEADESGDPELEADSVVLDRIARSRLPDAILSAVRRHRRLGQRGAADPIVLRDPLRACAKVFAKIRRSVLASAL
jgi:DNA-binding response OmpR family regulator